MGKGRKGGGRKGGAATTNDDGGTAGVDATTSESMAAAAAAAFDAEGATVTHAPTNYRPGVPDIVIESLDVAFHGRSICENATLHLTLGRRYGLVGPNGCGKSTLINCLASGVVPFPPNVDFFALRHEVAGSDTMTPLQAVMGVDKERVLLERELEGLGACDPDDERIANRMEEIYERLDELEADTAESRAGKILFGLGFTKEMQLRPTSSYSGGWRMRIALAQALFVNPTLLLLDEPTNHLDIEAVVWLEGYLSRFKKILLMVSHSQDFMNGVCTNIIHMHRGKLIAYEGNYDQYVITRSEKETHQMKRYVWQQQQVRSMKEYIARFGHGHKKLARQAQSKEKTLEKMTRGGMTEAVVKDRNVTFGFPSAGPLPPPILQFREVSFAYPGRAPLFSNLDLGLDLESRICLVGPNGAGKTTLTKLITRDLEPTTGYVAKNAHCTIARFHQHFVDQLDLSQTPLQWMHHEFPDVVSPEVFRGALGRFGVTGPYQSAPMKTLSDGLKTRCVFAWMAHRCPHMLILDEPTNHLDMDSIDALADAISEFEGAVVVVSHDLRLIAQVAETLWIVDGGAVTVYSGDIADYKEYVQRRVDQMTREYAQAK